MLISEREDELIKNRTKCTEHNQILAHIREKMHHTDEVIDFTECDLGDAEMDFLRAREDLGQVKVRSLYYPMSYSLHISENSVFFLVIYAYPSSIYFIKQSILFCFSWLTV